MTARHRYHVEIDGTRITSKKRPLALFRNVAPTLPPERLETLTVYKTHKGTGAVTPVATLADIGREWGEM